MSKYEKMLSIYVTANRYGRIRNRRVAMLRKKSTAFEMEIEETNLENVTQTHTFVFSILKVRQKCRRAIAKD